jgi:hypothetical protein
MLISPSLENFGWIRRLIWNSNGFFKLRLLQEHIENVEPWFNPAVIPISHQHNGHDTEQTPESADSTSVSTPSKNLYYSSADYHRMYLTGELTPMAVARALLPLIRKDISPPGQYSVGWHETRVDMVLAAAEASTLRYKKKCPIGPLDGVPCGVKDDYDIEGYRTNLGSANDYTEKTINGRNNTSWCVKKVQESGVMIMGKLTMPEFGMGKFPNLNYSVYRAAGIDFFQIPAETIQYMVHRQIPIIVTTTLVAAHLDQRMLSVVGLSPLL